ncbi:50S ribosomal protein L3 [Candidatus Nomurabacteria bacterium RIFCSPHIGHO2_01_FULL_39_9]|uniref:Large ribosomal subunit protein uL3 n=1 Tax=Candidatus Nomurabacteria bacterium RIFCSPHIGHO2_01_FULL_39_9 TaxID=1801735 RepID=A0A1F6UUQ8_9BACT|nr:MAG: 50S ribosomal protein L3 [Candidatus Nomurabacteria bacterium RIFCSPHIGHO2_01_FULL_39_9]
MKNFALGTKKQMLSFFTSDGVVIPATVIEIKPLKIVELRTEEKNGYNAIVAGLGSQRKEFKMSVDELKDLKVGDEIAIKLAAGDKIKVTGISKGKGFRGVVKRHGFGGGRRTHGQKHSENEPGSIGGGLRTRVPKGMRMAGRMGGDTIAVRNLKILEVLPEALLISGAVPGNRGTVLKIEAL